MATTWSIILWGYERQRQETTGCKSQIGFNSRKSSEIIAVSSLPRVRYFSGQHIDFHHELFYKSVMKTLS
ncbi:hypothetical protein OsI_04162 [Oryza sativa Indica Group]|uniref:Uncharacterized protein n=1 Tax=Oryza sativa subsp. indica TaxID=39946 RepID=A2WW80_ORYSI|nr:hypothetical protein OsI_04162 [Oryza sativa Indica Group]